MRPLARPLAVAILQRRDEILVSPVPDPVKKVTGYRPPGGTIEFQELGSDAAVREIKEELGVDVIEPRYLGTLENIFEWLGHPGHELVRVYRVRFADASLYERTTFDCVEANGAGFVCEWRALGGFGGEARLYPEGLRELLEGRG